MPKKEKKGNKTGRPAPAEEQVETAQEQVEEPEAGSSAAEALKTKYKYNPVAAKAYRERIMEFAKKGGYEPKPRAEGTGLTEKRTSKTGTTYYYQPWSTLTDEQKKKRLAQARERAARDREMARKYREEHPEPKEES